MEMIERLWAYEEIRQLAYRYAFALDSRNTESLAALYVSDGNTERDALIQRFDQILAKLGISILHVTNHLIDLIDDSHASGKVYCQAQVEQNGQWIHQAICYEDKYKKNQDQGIDQWLFSSRKHLLWYAFAGETNPCDQSPCDDSGFQQGTGSLPGYWETWQTFMDRKK